MTYFSKLHLSCAPLIVFLASTISTTVLATPLPEISSAQIAEDAQRSFDGRTGVTEVVLPTFDPFEGQEDLAGTAALRSTGLATTLDGRTVSGGAVLDLAMIYTTASNDPYDNRGFEQGAFISGDPVDVIRYDNRILDCSEKVREVVYDDSYYRGAPYGYVAGVYRHYPRYRGHIGFGAFNGYGYYRPRRGHRAVRGYRGHRGYGHAGPHRPRADRPRGDRPRVDRPRGDRPRGDRPRGDRPRGDAHRGPDIREGLPRGMHYDHFVDYRTSNRAKGRKAGDGRRPRAERPRAERPRAERPRAERPRAERPRAERPRAERPRAERPRAERPRAERPRAQRPSATAPRSNEGRSVNRARSNANRSRVNRAVDKTFRSHNPRGAWQRRSKNFFPLALGGYNRTDVYVTYRCAREETLSVHIPEDRLEAARFDGFTVIILDREGRELPVYIPPNYVEGYRQAVVGLSRTNYTPDRATSVQSTPLYKAPTPPQPDTSSNAPIIYGDPSGITVPQGSGVVGGYPQGG